VHAIPDIVQVGQLGTKVKMQQLQTVQQVLRAQPFHQVQHLRRVQPELGFAATGILPVTRSD